MMTNSNRRKPVRVPDLFIAPEEAAALKSADRDYPFWVLLPDQSDNLELILNGGFHPLQGFMTQAETREVLENKTWRGEFFPVPIRLQVDQECAEQVSVGEPLALRDQEGLLVAILTVSELTVSELTVSEERASSADARGQVFLAGQCQGVAASVHYDFKRLRDDPGSLREKFSHFGWRSVAGYITHEPLHQKEVHECCAAMQHHDTRLLLSLATSGSEDPVHHGRVRAIERVLGQFPSHTAAAVLLPLPGPALSESDMAEQADTAHVNTATVNAILLHALTLRNFGCSHYMVDERYPGVGDRHHYQQLLPILSSWDQTMGITLIHPADMVHCPARGGYVARSALSANDVFDALSPEAFREGLVQGLAIPDWYSYPEVLQEIKKVIKPLAQQGFTIFFTGLSGSGKSTIANTLLIKLMELQQQVVDRRITLLDGDIVRQNLSSELGFSKAHRDLNVRRIGYVASEITRHGGVAICAPIAPYEATRVAVRQMIQAVGGFVEVHVSTSLVECERRDRKGLYAKARAGVIKEFTGISDPYEIPESPELIIDTEGMSPNDAADIVLSKLVQLGYIAPPGGDG